MDSFCDRIEGELQAAWRRSDDLFGLLDAEALLYRPIVWRHPFVFYLGHLPAFAWNQTWGEPRRRQSPNPFFDEIFSRGIDPDVDTGACHAHPEAPRRWPEAAEIAGYRDAVREAVVEALDGLRSKAGKNGGERERFCLTLEHELMHQETLLYMIHHLAPERKVRPRGLPEHVFDGRARSEEIAVPAGRARLGAARGGIEFGWDNEFEGCEADVPGFRMDSLPVTIGQFFAFVESGAYDDRRYWTDGEWAWKAREGARHPNFWLRERGEWVYRAMFDLLPLPSVSSWPVYASLAEARAYAKWKNKRLPTEAEYHRAAFCGPEGKVDPYPWGEEAPSARRGNFDFTRWSPAPVGSNPEGMSAWGIHELSGNGWEWTGTPFAPFSGFVPLETYRGYSVDFFDGKHYVLKGASWATAARLMRPSFRNWYQAHYPYVFAKFRCVS